MWLVVNPSLLHLGADAPRPSPPAVSPQPGYLLATHAMYVLMCVHPNGRSRSTSLGLNVSCNAWTYYDTLPSPSCELAPFATITYPPQNVTSGSTTPPTWQPPAPPPPLPTTGECQYVNDTIYNEPAAGDTWEQKTATTSAGQCCAICRTLPQCAVSNYQPTPWDADTVGTCTMRGQVNLSRPTHVPNATVSNHI